MLPRFAVASFLSLVVAAAPHTAVADHIPSGSDLWDVSQGAVVTAHSPVPVGGFFGSHIEGMFGGTLAGTVEPTNTLFQDGQPTGTLHWVEWQTADPITLRSFTLFAHHDGPPRDANWRGFSAFRLFAFNEDTGEFDNLLFELFPANPYGTTTAPAFSEIAPHSLDFVLILHANVVPTTTDRFRAEFVQFGFGASNASGPRIVELDGWDTFHEGVASPDPDVPDVVEVAIDIKPGGDPNSINLRARGVLPVAILSTEDFDALQVDEETVLFGDPLAIAEGGAPVAPIRSSVEDVDGDGLDDLLLFFSIPDIAESGALNEDSEFAVLIGETFDGVSIEGIDTVRIVPPAPAGE